MIFNEARSIAGGLSVTQRDGDRQSLDVCCYFSVLSQISVSLMNSSFSHIKPCISSCHNFRMLEKNSDSVQLRNKTFSEN